MFKVGEKVVGLTSETDEILEVKEYSCKEKRNGEPSIFMCFKSKLRDDFCVVGLQVRHATPEEIAASHRIDKSPLMRHLNECEEVVKTWPKWKLQSVRDAFGIHRHTSEANDMGDDSHIENHISPHCKVSEACVDEALKLNRLG